MMCTSVHTCSHWQTITITIEILESITPEFLNSNTPEFLNSITPELCLTRIRIANIFN